MAIELSDNILINIMRNYIKDNINKEYIIDLIHSKLSDSDKGILLELLLSQEEYEPFDINDIVWVKINNYDSSQYGCQNSLRDLGLIKDGYILGKISDSDNYSSDFDKWHYKFKVEIIIRRDDKWMINTELTFDRKEMKHISGSKLNHEMVQAFRNKYAEIAI